MRYYQQTDSSLNQILQMFRTYQQGDRQRDSSQLSFDSKIHFHSEDPQLNSPLVTLRHLQLTLQHPKSSKPFGQNIKQTKSIQSPPSGSIFHRLYNENQSILKKRQMLFEQGKKENRLKQTKQCTFRPRLHSHSQRSNRLYSESKGNHFYQKNIQWQARVDQAVKTQQAERSNRALKQLTFSPRIVTNIQKQNHSKSNNKVSVMQKKGVADYLHRQKKARAAAEDLLRSRQSRKGDLNSTQATMIF